MTNRDISVYCLKYAESLLSESMIFDGGDDKKQIPISFAIYLIKCGGRNILVDAGCNTMPGFEMKNFCSPTFVLSQIGLSAEDITDVIITHAHHDHIEAVKHFHNAVIYISNLEYEEGKQYIPDSFKVVTFEKEYSITSEIKIIECGGHSKGSSIVKVKTDNITHVFAGDECYTDANIENKICTGSFTNKENAIRFIEKYSSNEYRVHTCHDIKLKTEMII